MWQIQPFFSTFKVFEKIPKETVWKGWHDTFRFSHFGEISHKIKTLLLIDINNFQERGPTTNSDLFILIVWFCCTSNHPQVDLATFGYKPTMKVKNLEKPFYTLAICFNNVKKHGDFEDFFQILEIYKKE